MSLYTAQAGRLREIAGRLNVPSIRVEARTPGIISIFRVTAHYHDGRARESVGTLVRSAADGWWASVVYRGGFGAKPIRTSIPQSRAETFARALSAVGFDRMSDAPNVPMYDVTDLWLVERAAGTFVHALVLAPEIATDDHARLVNAIRHGMPELIRVVPG
jgi:hypothetical protein